MLDRNTPDNILLGFQIGHKGVWMMNVYAHLRSVLFKQTNPHITAFGLHINKNQLPKPCRSALQVWAKLNSTLSHWDKSGTALLKSGKLPLGSENTNESRRCIIKQNCALTHRSVCGKAEMSPCYAGLIHFCVTLVVRCCQAVKTHAISMTRRCMMHWLLFRVGSEHLVSISDEHQAFLLNHLWCLSIHMLISEIA